MKNIRRVAALLGTSLTLMIAPASAIEEASDTKTKINLAGRQRMLSQKMAKASCFAYVDQANFEHLSELTRARDDFDTTLTGLVEGNAGLQLNAETNDSVLSALSDVAALWAPFQAAVNDILGVGSVDEARLGVISETNIPVLVRMNETVGVIETTYASGGDVDATRGRTINVAGRQRMLSQKMAKEFCMVVAGIEAAANREALQATMNQFEAALQHLIAGTDGLEVPNAAIGTRLERVGKVYEAVKASYERTISGEEPTEEDLKTVAVQSNRVLREMNQIVFAYSVVD